MASVMAMDPPANVQADNISYQIPPAVADSYAIAGGKWYNEIKNAQSEFHKAHVDLRIAKAKGDGEAAGYAEGMVKHHEQVIGHFMQLRNVGM